MATFDVRIQLKRPITDELRQSVLEDLPMLNEVKDKDLVAKAVEAWCLALNLTSFERLSDVPGCAFPGQLELKHGGQNVHLNGTAKLAIGMAHHLRELEPTVDIDDDVVIVGSVVHDLGKAYELDPENVKRWEAEPSKVGYQPLRHPIYGAALAMVAGLPESVCHIVANHSAEGAKVIRSLECNLVYAADVAWWFSTASSGVLKPETVKGLLKKWEPRDLADAIEHE